MSDPAVQVHIRGNSAQLQKEFEKAGKATQVFASKAQETSKALRRVQSDVSGLAMGANSMGVLATQFTSAAGASEHTTRAMSDMTSGLVQARYAVIALSAAKQLMTGPLAMITAGVAGAAAAYVYFTGKSREAEEAARSLAQAKARNLECTLDMIDALKREAAQGVISERSYARASDAYRKASEADRAEMERLWELIDARKAANEAAEAAAEAEKARVTPINALIESIERHNDTLQWSREELEQFVLADRIATDAEWERLEAAQKLRAELEEAARVKQQNAQAEAAAEAARKSAADALVREADALTSRFIPAQDRIIAQAASIEEHFIAGRISVETYAAAMEDLVEQTATVATRSQFAQSAIDGLSGAFTDLMLTGRTSIEDVIMGLVRMQMMAGFQAGLGSLFPNAHGNAFAGGRVIAMARGGIVDRPTIFPMARGAGLMGEAGPEAVMPLGRTRAGDLGVQLAGGGGGAVTVNVINQAPNTEASTRETTGPNGEREIEVVIVQAVRGGIARGALDGAMGSRFGVSPRGNRR